MLNNFRKVNGRLTSLDFDRERNEKRKTTDALRETNVEMYRRANQIYLRARKRTLSRAAGIV